MKHYQFIILTAFFPLFTMNCMADDWDTYPDTWVAVDELGREVYSSDTQGITADKENGHGHVVGLFYYLWHGSHLINNTGQIYDVTEILKKNTDNPQWGPIHEMHWWGRPILDYYKAGDPFVLEKHMQMICDAGVDFLFFDVTNAFTYPEVVKQIMQEIDRRQNLGMKVPKLCFMVHSFTQNTVQNLYDDFYSKSQYDKYWYTFKGKPLILGNKAEVTSQTLLDRFTWRNSWAWMNGAKSDEWSWLEYYPQAPGWSGTRLNKEQISVSTAQHSSTKVGKSYHNGTEPPLLPNATTLYTGQGLYYSEQWKQAHKVNPQHIMITQFNEWQAMRFIAGGSDGFGVNDVRPCGKHVNGESVFVDTYNAEFNRDIEPSRDSTMRDNYLMQTISNIRQYKGVRNIPIPSPAKTITLNGDMAQWVDVEPEYRDDKCDVVHRNYQNYTGYTTLENKTGRNDFIVAKVTKDTKNIYFYIQTHDNISNLTAFTKQWMMLYLNTDTCYKTGWEGYDYMVTRDKVTRKYSLMRNISNQYKWENLGEITRYVEGNKMYFAISRSLLGMDGGKECDIDFKWADNTPDNPNILDFYIDGDVAPNGRFNYRYKGSAISTTGIKNINVEQDIIANIRSCHYKNGKIQLNIQALNDGKSSITVYSQNGELISRKNLRLIHGDNAVWLNASRQPVIVQITQNGKSKICKVL